VDSSGWLRAKRQGGSKNRGTFLSSGSISRQARVFKRVTIVQN